ncbi:MAG: YicC family protein [Planctomycetes bacterium]|nr:YicC family protein [Planctomycetota bacterium]
MLLSMTGFGDARDENDRLAVCAEVRTVNHRHLKIMIRCPEAYVRLESEIEKLVRERIGRGTVTVTLRIVALTEQSHYRLDEAVLKAYWEEIHRIARQIAAAPPADLAPLVALPGSVAEALEEAVDYEQDWPVIRRVLEAALEKLQQFRVQEGRAMQQELEQQCAVVRTNLDRIAERAPEVVVAFRDRLRQRVAELLAEFDVQVDTADLLREVSVFSERCDIGEEITRLRCHLDQFAAFLKEKRSLGRKLDFLSQEMFREINTIGAKANDVAIAHGVVEMKAATERIREILQNVE